jgi:hypothetical protein
MAAAPTHRFIISLLLLLLSAIRAYAMRVAVTGTTGRLGRVS